MYSEHAFLILEDKMNENIHFIFPVKTWDYFLFFSILKNTILDNVSKNYTMKHVGTFKTF